MAVQIDQIFTAKAESIQAFLSTAGQCFYIPAYQRAYAWDEDNVDRLFEDTINGLNHLMERDEAVSFLGTIIAIHDTLYQTVRPLLRPEVPPRVMTIIDGQQRITTSIMMNIALHAQLCTLLKKLGSVEGEQFDWAREQTKQAVAELKKTFVLDQATGTPDIYRYYPRIIRALADVWSKRKVQAMYNSPIATLIWLYVEHIEREEAKGAFKYRVVTSDGKGDARHAPLQEIFAYIVRRLTYVTTKETDKTDFPDIQQAVTKPNYIQALWSYPAPDHVVKFITEGSADRHFQTYVQLFRTLIFYKYFCSRVALTIVTTRTEDDAFDMFEALNTTGEPLTAYETFKPKVIEAEELESYETSPSYTALSRIDKYLEGYKKADDRQRATSEMLIPFALAETGHKLQKNLNDQRRYLRDSFDKLDGLEAKRDTVKSMANLSAFMETAWSPPIDEVPTIEGSDALDSSTGFALQALRHLKHQITIAAISRFYDQLRRASPEDRASHMGDFFAAIKAATAFSMLWRGAKGGTENVDAYYRSVMERGDKEKSIPPLAKHTGGNRGVVSLNNFKRLLRLGLFDQYPTKEDWVKTASRQPIYAHSSVVAKFLIIAASHDTVVATKPGLLERGRPGVSPTMVTDIWRADSNFSIEHVAPQKKAAGWQEAIYEQGEESFDLLGNLTLLPQAANSYVGGKSWAHKRLLYRYFSASTQAEADTVKAEFGAAGLAVSASGEIILRGSAYMPMCRAIAGYDGEWTKEFIAERSVRLAELAYDNIIGWLDVEAS